MIKLNGLEYRGGLVLANNQMPIQPVIHCPLLSRKDAKSHGLRLRRGKHLLITTKRKTDSTCGQFL